MTSLIALLRKINHWVALTVGFILLACVAFTLVEIVVRRVGLSLGGVDEISGYVMAIVTSWGVSYALTEMAHVRIDLLRNRLIPLFRSVFDMIAILSLAATGLVVAWRGWGVVSKTLSTGARANTPLETPLWIPQIFWWAGWTWFAVTACILVLSTLYFIVRGDHDRLDNTVGARAEV
ncbi:TRAP transporter small permease subunit [Sneathiella chinensis]|uniref:TRAP transporter small permease protein n=1 Tax=Sneathiella chinensis TaxID=349750 RepID=A0ABQ5U3H8_9PROT|nr:TRAP transporter small permease [Sneathiella chinensis]GLQ05051.1 C4-dicarboxylate ABC transporter permease [Sneathiella chinensis]